MQFATSTTITADFETIELTKMTSRLQSAAESPASEDPASHVKRRLSLGTLEHSADESRTLSFSKHPPTFLDMPSTRSDYKEYGTPPANDQDFLHSDDPWSSKIPPNRSSHEMLTHRTPQSAQTVRSRSRTHPSASSPQLSPILASPSSPSPVRAPGLDDDGESTMSETLASSAARNNPPLPTLNEEDSEAELGSYGGASLPSRTPQILDARRNFDADEMERGESSG